ncbi:hypothetical protein ACEN33_00655 [Ruoffia sp. FAM 24228]|uniref:hypothetical protein n=1 Tax=Ruoffia sp. FAM 24228 TaxID=3259517 RepID=UPI003886B5DE
MMNILMILMFFAMFFATFTTIDYFISLYKKYRIYQKAYDISVNKLEEEIERVNKIVEENKL